MTFIIFTEYKFSKSAKKMKRNVISIIKCHFNNQSRNYSASSWADRSKYHDRWVIKNLCSVFVTSMFMEHWWSNSGEVCTFRTVTYWTWIDLKIFLAGFQLIKVILVIRFNVLSHDGPLTGSSDLLDVRKDAKWESVSIWIT